MGHRKYVGKVNFGDFVFSAAFSSILLALFCRYEAVRHTAQGAVSESKESDKGSRGVEGQFND